MSIRIITILFYFIVCLAFSGCGSRPSENHSPPPVISEPKNLLPFSTRELESFYVTAVVSTAGKMEEMEIARKADSFMIGRYVGTPQHFTLISGEGRYIVLHDKKSYAEIDKGTSQKLSADEITSLLLSAKDHSTYETIASSGETSIYRSRQIGSGSSYAELTIDNSNNLPVKYELFNDISDERIALFTMELNDFRSDIDDSYFRIPAGYKKVSFENLRTNIFKND